MVRLNIVNLLHIVNQRRCGLYPYIFDIFTFSEGKSATTFTDKGVQRDGIEFIVFYRFAFDIKFNNTLAQRFGAVIFKLDGFRYVQHTVFQIGSV